MAVQGHGPEYLSSLANSYELETWATVLAACFNNRCLVLNSLELRLT